MESEWLQPLAPPGTIIDTYQGTAYVSLVEFLFSRTKVLGIPALLHQQFEEVNLRFYVRRLCEQEWRRGVVFVREIVPRFLISRSARWFYNENYITCPMRHRIEQTQGRSLFEYAWKFQGQWNSISVAASADPQPIRAGSLEEFLTHHEWGYTRQPDSSCLEYRVTHPRWEVASAIESAVQCDAIALYGPNLAAALAEAPRSAFAIPGSAVTVYFGTRLSVAR